MSNDEHDNDPPEERTVVDRVLAEMLMEQTPSELQDSAPPQKDGLTPWKDPASTAGTRVLPRTGDAPPPAPEADHAKGASDWSTGPASEEVTGLWERSWGTDDVGPDDPGPQVRPNTEDTRSASMWPDAWFIMTQGPSVGMRFKVLEGETRVGRATHCDWVIDAPSISRKHATLELTPDGCWIRDEGANNGSFVNGERVRRRRLENGMSVRLGEVEFRFESDALRPRVREETSRKIAMTRRHDIGFRRWWGRPSSARWTGLLVGLFVLAGSVWGGYWLMRYQSDAKRERVEIAHDYYRRGVESFLSREWDEAREKFVLLQAYDPDHARADVYRRAIERERKVEATLEEVRAARDRGDLAHGLALLRELPSTVLFEQDVGGLVRALDSEVDSRIARARADAQAGQWSKVAETVQSLLAARPKDGFLMALRSHAMSIAATLPKGAGGSSADNAKRSAVTPAQSGEGARAIYAKGDFEAALDFTRLNPDDPLSGKLEAFRPCVRDLAVEPNSKNAPQLSSAYERCVALDAALSGSRPSAYGRRLGKKLSQTLYLSGLSSLAKDEGHRAFIQFQKAIKTAPNTSAQLQLDSLARRAETMLLRGQALIESQPREAEKLFRRALGLVPAESRIADNLRASLSKL